MAKTSYYTVDGEILGERAAGARRNYGVDALGSVTSTIQGSAIENQYAYKPYGEQLQKTGTASDPRFNWNGTVGYLATTRAWVASYVRARHYSHLAARWIRRDPLWPSQPAYGYDDAPVNRNDPSGLCYDLAIDIGQRLAGLIFCNKALRQSPPDPKPLGTHKVLKCGKNKHKIEAHLLDVCKVRIPLLASGPMRSCLEKRCTNVEITCLTADECGGSNSGTFGETPGQQGVIRIGMGICPEAFQKQKAGCLGKTILHEMCHTCGELELPPDVYFEDYCEGLAVNVYGPGRPKCPD